MIFQGGGGPDPLSPLWIRTCVAPSLGRFKPEPLPVESSGGPDIKKIYTKTINPPGPVLATAKEQPESV